MLRSMHSNGILVMDIARMRILRANNNRNYYISDIDIKIKDTFSSDSQGAKTPTPSRVGTI
jgi:hypothetical protein